MADPCWPDLLDALEERNRRVERLLRGEPTDVPDVELCADGPLPVALALRAQLLLAQTRRLERLADARSRTTARALHYRRA